VLIHLGDIAAVFVSVLAWLFIGFSTGFVLHRVPVKRFDHDTWLTRPRRFEDEGNFYQRKLKIRKWKDRLPEKGDLFPDGFSKRHLTNRSTEHLERFMAETRRAETVHWLNLSAGPLFLIWCRPLLGAFMIVFGVVAHLPFVMVQRYNRERLGRLLRRRRPNA
jgi:glycosyl-4,4'-diaponeurosporenoate acyltransferase